MFFCPGNRKSALSSVQHCHTPRASSVGVTGVHIKRAGVLQGGGKGRDLLIFFLEKGGYLPYRLVTETIQHRNGTELDFHFCFAVHL